MSVWFKVPTPSLHTAAGAAVGIVGLDGKEYLFPLLNSPVATDNYEDKSSTPGNVSTNAYRGRVAAAASATTLTVTNNRVTTTSYIGTNLATNDATAVIKSVVPGNGSFTINLTAPTAQVSIDFVVLG